MNFPQKWLHFVLINKERVALISCFLIFLTIFLLFLTSCGGRSTQDLWIDQTPAAGSMIFRQSNALEVAGKYVCYEQFAQNGSGGIYLAPLSGKGKATLLLKDGVILGRTGTFLFTRDENNLYYFDFAGAGSDQAVARVAYTASAVDFCGVWAQTAYFCSILTGEDGVDSVYLDCWDLQRGEILERRPLPHLIGGDWLIADDHAYLWRTSETKGEKELCTLDLNSLEWTVLCRMASSDSNIALARARETLFVGIENRLYACEPGEEPEIIAAFGSETTASSCRFDFYGGKAYVSYWENGDTAAVIWDLTTRRREGDLGHAEVAACNEYGILLKSGSQVRLINKDEEYAFALTVDDSEGWDLNGVYLKFAFSPAGFAGMAPQGIITAAWDGRPRICS